MSVPGRNECSVTNHGDLHPATCFCPIQDEYVVVVEGWRYPERYVRTVLLPRLLGDARRLEKPDLAPGVIGSGEVFDSLNIGHGVHLNSKFNGVILLSVLRLKSHNNPTLDFCLMRDKRRQLQPFT